MCLVCCIIGIQAVNGSSHAGWLLDEGEKPGRTVPFGRKARSLGDLSNTDFLQFLRPTASQFPCVCHAMADFESAELVLRMDSSQWLPHFSPGRLRAPERSPRIVSSRDSYLRGNRVELISEQQFWRTSVLFVHPCSKSGTARDLQPRQANVPGFCSSVSNCPFCVARPRKYQNGLVRTM